MSYARVALQLKWINLLGQKSFKNPCWTIFLSFKASLSKAVAPVQSKRTKLMADLNHTLMDVLGSSKHQQINQITETTTLFPEN